jgi:hypothetical protein
VNIGINGRYQGVAGIEVSSGVATQERECSATHGSVGVRREGWMSSPVLGA